MMSYPKPDSSYAFIYDGTLEGLLCAIFETYRQKLVPSEIVTEESLQLRLEQQPITIPTSPAIAQRVKDGLVPRLRPQHFQRHWGGVPFR